MTAVPGVDWRVVAATGRALVPPGPDVDRPMVRELVADLHTAAARATDAVAAVSGLDRPPSVAVAVVDRSTWVTGASEMARSMLAAIGQQPPVSLSGRVAARAAGLQLGAAFAFVATRILGQFDPYSPAPRLLLVAPNVLAVERALGVEPHGFRQWVCLHEETHRFQFGAAPWLPAHLLRLMGAVFADDGSVTNAPVPVPGAAAKLMSGHQMAALDRITAVMSLLEGHADVTMDHAGRERDLVPQVDLLRASIQARRDAPGLVRVISNLLGLRAKHEQYLHGGAFCRAVIAAAGVECLNVAFAAPELLPTLSELHRPADWLDRVPERVG